MSEKKNLIILKAAIFLLAVVRLITLPFNVITDITEARYAEIARKMFFSGDFITPFFREGTPFWGKPPLSFWANAISYHIFGVNEFAARFPPFLFTMGAVALIYFFSKKHFGIVQAHVAAVVLLSCTIFLYLGAGVMTDPALTFCVILALCGFFNALEGYGKKAALAWGYVFFSGLGLALLAKGPLALILVGISTGLWVIIKNKWALIWKKIPWITGTVLMLVIALPWYILAELKTPGFLEYFIIGEHFQRYLVPRWTGDMYGQGRGGFMGIIWVFYLAVLMPWPVYLAYRMFGKEFRSKLKEIRFIKDEKVLYVLLCSIGPLIFLTLSKNVILPYVLPMLPFSAILISLIICNNERKNLNTDKFVLVTALNAVVFIAMVSSMNTTISEELFKSDKFIIEKFEEVRGDNPTPLLYYKRGIRNSTLFYAKESIISVFTREEIEDYVNKYGTVYILAHDAELTNTEIWKGLSAVKIYDYTSAMLLEVRREK